MADFRRCVLALFLLLAVVVATPLTAISAITAAPATVTTNNASLLPAAFGAAGWTSIDATSPPARLATGATMASNVVLADAPNCISLSVAVNNGNITAPLTTTGMSVVNTLVESNANSPVTVVGGTATVVSPNVAGTNGTPTAAL